MISAAVCGSTRVVFPTIVRGDQDNGRIAHAGRGKALGRWGSLCRGALRRDRVALSGVKEVGRSAQPDPPPAGYSSTYPNTLPVSPDTSNALSCVRTPVPGCVSEWLGRAERAGPYEHPCKSLPTSFCFKIHTIIAGRTGGDTLEQ